MVLVVVVVFSFWFWRLPNRRVEKVERDDVDLVLSSLRSVALELAWRRSLGL